MSSASEHLFGVFTECQFENFSTENFWESAASMHSSHFVHGPVAKDRFAIDVAGGDRTEIPAIVRHRPVIPKNKIAVV
jgi:hypothetical protein